MAKIKLLKMPHDMVMFFVFVFVFFNTAKKNL